MAPKRAAPSDPKATLSPMVLVSGDTYEIREGLKALGGGAWCKMHSGWVFPEEKRAGIEALLETGGIAVSAQQQGDAKPEPEFVATTDAGASLTVSNHKKAILVTGDTAEVKETLKSLKGSWNRGLQGWIFQANRREEVIGALRKDPTNTVTESDKPAQPAAAKKQKLEDEAFIDDSSEE